MISDDIAAQCPECASRSHEYVGHEEDDTGLLLAVIARCSGCEVVWKLCTE